MFTINLNNSYKDKILSNILITAIEVGVGK